MFRKRTAVVMFLKFEKWDLRFELLYRRGNQKPIMWHTCDSLSGFWRWSQPHEEPCLEYENSGQVSHFANCHQQSLNQFFYIYSDCLTTIPDAHSVEYCLSWMKQNMFIPIRICIFFANFSRILTRWTQTLLATYRLFPARSKFALIHDNNV